MNPRWPWALLAMACVGVVALSLGLTHWLDLHPCHLCIFQRLLFMILTVLALLASAFWPAPGARLAGGLSLPVASGGVAVAAYQSWLQAQPAGSATCAGGQPGLIERLVEWLGQQAPELFLVTGYCEEVELEILGLSLANLALLSYIGCLAVAAWALWLGRSESARGR